MRKPLLTVLISLHLPVAVAQSQTASVVLRTARVLNVETGRMTAPGEILVQGERIVEVGAAVSHPAGEQVLDLGDRTLLPGLIDAHVHLFLHPGADGTRDMAQARGILTIVDGALPFSQLPFKVSNFKCDFYGVILHKWTFAPVGTGFLLCAEVADQRYMAAARGARPAGRERRPRQTRRGASDKTPDLHRNDAGRGIHGNSHFAERLYNRSGNRSFRPGRRGRVEESLTVRSRIGEEI